MKKLFVIMALAVFIAATSGFAFAFSFDNDDLSTSLDAVNKKKGPKGPAPNSGDGIPDGSGF